MELRHFRHREIFLQFFSKMPRSKLKAATRSDFTCKIKYIFPKRKINRIFPNLDDQLVGCFLVREGRGRASGNDMKDVYFFTHPELSDEEFYIVKRFAKITEEGPEVGFSEQEQTHRDEAESNEGDVEVPTTSGDLQEDVARFLRDGFVVDDDNLPAPENVPNGDDPTDAQLIVPYGQLWTLRYCSWFQSFLTP